MGGFKYLPGEMLTGQVKVPEVEGNKNLKDIRVGKGKGRVSIDAGTWSVWG